MDEDRDDEDRDDEDRDDEDRGGDEPILNGGKQTAHNIFGLLISA